MGPAAGHLISATPTGRRLWAAPHLYDQGQTPRCTAYATSGAMTARYANFAGPDIVFDADALYAWANANDGIAGPHDGSTVRAALTGVQTQGEAVISVEGRDPYRQTVGERDKISRYLWADTTLPDADTLALISWLLVVGPVVIGIDWKQTMFCEHDDGTPNIPASGMIDITGTSAGGHAVLLRGAFPELPGQPFCIRNSWGAWGGTCHPDGSFDPATPSGDILIARHDLALLLADQGEAGAPAGVL